MQTVLITGGTGLVGNQLAKLLLSKGYTVIIMTRTLPANQNENKQLQYAKWNIETKQYDTSAFEAADIITHLAGAGVADKRWSTKRKQEIVESRVKSGELIVQALKETNNKVKTVISASAIGWYGADTKESLAKPFTEDAKADTAFLGNTCKLWEESILPVQDQGIRLVILRIGIVLSNDGGALVEFKKPIKFGLATILGNGKQIISWIHIDDLCNLFLYACENNQLNGGYNAVAPNPVNNKTLTLQLAKEMRGSFFIPVFAPAFMLKIILGEMSIEVLKSTHVSSKKVQAAGFAFRYPTIQPALQALINE